MTNTAEKPYPLGPHIPIYIADIREYPPLPGIVRYIKIINEVKTTENLGSLKAADIWWRWLAELPTKLMGLFLIPFTREHAQGRCRQRRERLSLWRRRFVCPSHYFANYQGKVAKRSCCFTPLCGLFDWFFWLFIVCRAPWLVECLVCAGEVVWFWFWRSHCTNHSIQTKRRMQTVLTSRNNRVEVKEVKSLQ